MRAKGSRGIRLLPLAMVAVGVLFLLSNFLFLSGFNLLSLSPLLLVVAGAVMLLRGDLLVDEGRTFGITRGSVESATLEISAGEIDVRLHPLQREGRLIAGMFAADSKPELFADDAHVTLRMHRSATPWLSFADWEAHVAGDLPWQVLVSTSLGQIDLMLDGVITQEVIAASGIGDIRLTCPREAFAPLRLRSALGNIHVTTPAGGNTRIIVNAPSIFRVHADQSRYAQDEPGIYTPRDADETTPVVEVYISGTFGDAYLA